MTYVNNYKGFSADGSVSLCLTVEKRLLESTYQRVSERVEYNNKLTRSKIATSNMTNVNSLARNHGNK